MPTLNTSKNVCKNVQTTKCKNVHNVGNRLKDPRLVAPDGGWGWMIALATFFTGCLIGTIGVTFSLILEDLLIAMDTSTSTASWVPSSQLFIGMLCAPFASAMCLRSSYRKTAIIGGLIYFIALFSSSYVKHIEVLILTLGVFVGLGGAFVFPSMLFAINDYFDKRRGRVTGIFMSGLSFGRFSSALILQVLLNIYGFRGTMLITSAIMLNVCVCASILQPVSWHLIPSKDVQSESNVSDEPMEKVVNKLANKENNILSTDSLQRIEENDEAIGLSLNIEDSVAMKMKITDVSTGNPSNNKKLWGKFRKAMRLDFTVIQNPCFFIVCASHIIHMSVSPYVFSFLPSLGVTKGYEPLNAAMLLSSLSLGEIFGQLCTPWLLDLKILKARTVLIIESFCLATLLWVITTSADYYVDIAICGIGGLFMGGLASTNMFASVHVLGPLKFPSVIAFIQFIQSFFSLITGPLLGFARDYTGKFQTTFVIMSCIQYCTVFIWLLDPYAKRRSLQRVKNVADA